MSEHIRRATLGAVLSAILLTGCAGSVDTAQDTTAVPVDALLASDATAADDAVTSPPDAVGSEIGGSLLTVSFESPARDQLVSGIVLIEAVATPPELVASIALEAPEGIPNTAQDPARFRGGWDSTTAPEGPSSLRIVATGFDGTRAAAELPVVVSHAPLTTLHGVVSLGTLIAGAQVEVYRQDGWTVGALLGTGTTTEAGVFAVNLPLDEVTTVFVRAAGSGTVYEELASGELHVFDSDDELTAITQVDPESTTNVVNLHALSSLAVAFGQLPDPVGGRLDVLDLAGDLLSGHVIRPAAFVPGDTPVADLTSGAISWPTPVAALGLFHAGLSAMAADISADSGTTVGSMDLVMALARDLRDRIFDGLDPSGQPILVLGTHALTVEATRWRLARGTDTFLATPENVSGLNYGPQAADGGFLTLVSTDQGPLYPAGPVKRYDKRPPVLGFSAPTPEIAAVVRQPFTIRVDTVDVSPLASLDLVKPEGAAVSELEVDLGARTLSALIDPAKAPDGELLILVEARDVSDNVGSADRYVVVDTTPPVVTIDPQPTLIDPATELTGGAVDATSGVAVVQVRSGDDLVASSFEDGSWSATPAWVEGEQEVSVTAIDVAGNKAEATALVTLDTQPPTLAVVTPFDGAFVNGHGFDLVIEAVDPSGVASVTVEHAEQTLDASLDAGSWRVTVVPADPDGLVGLAVRAIDAQGTASVEALPLTYTADATAPEIMAVGVVGGYDNGVMRFSKQPETTLWVTASDSGAGVASVCAATPCVGAEQEPGTWHVELTLGLAVTEVPVTAKDGVGNQAAVIATLGLDTEPPTCQITPPDAAYTNQTSVQLVGSSSDGSGSGVASVLVSNGMASFQGALEALSLWNASVALAPGPNILTATCVDHLGQAAQAAPVTLTVDQVPPAVTWVSPQPGDFVPADPLEVTVSVAEANPLDSVAFEVNGALQPASLNAVGHWVATVEPPLSDGPFPIIVHARDAAGNVAPQTLTVLRDATPPVVNGWTVDDVVTVGSDVYVGADAATIRVDATDGSGSGVAGVSVGGAVAAPIGGGVWLANVPLPSEGINQLSVLVVDAVGGSLGTTWTVHRDTVPPSCELTGPLVDQLALGKHWTSVEALTITGTAADAGSGIAGVALDLGGATNTAAAPAVQGETWQHGVTLSNGETSVVVTCSDAVGHTGAAGATVVLDTTPPTLTLAERTMRDEAGASYDFVAGEFGLNLVGQPQIAVPSGCQETAVQLWGCPTAFSKYSSRLAYQPEQPLLDQNLLSFAAVVDDDLVTPANVAALVVEYRFEKEDGSDLTPFRPVPTIEGSLQVPVATPFVADDAAAFVWTPAALPEVIAFRATDLAGNSQEARWRFHMSLKAPPIFLSQIDTWQQQPWDAGYFQLRSANPATALTNAFDQTGTTATVQHGGLRLARLEAYNPHSEPVLARIQLGPAYLYTKTSLRYLKWSYATPDPECSGATCFYRQCRTTSAFEPDLPPGTCFEASDAGAADVEQEQLWDQNPVLAFWAWEDLDNPGASELPLQDEATLIPAHTRVVVDVLVPVAGSCAITRAFRSYVPPQSEVAETAYFEAVDAGCVAPNEVPLGSANCVDVPGPGCQTLHFWMARVLTEVTLGRRSESGYPMSWTTYVPGFQTTGASSGQAAFPILLHATATGFSSEPYGFSAD